MYFSNFIKKIDTLRIFKHKTSNKIVISALKCGNRFMEESDCFDFIHLNDITLDDFKNADKIFWVIRDPKQHFISALITEVQVRYNLIENTFDNEKEYIVSLIKTKLLEILEEPILSLNFSHYQPRYELLTYMLQTEVRYFYNSTFVELKNLSELLETEFKCNYPYNEENYFLGFGKEYLINKKTLLDLLETEFISEWKIIQNIIEKETQFYNELKNISILENFISKIDSLNDTIVNLNKKIEKSEYIHLQTIIAANKTNTQLKDRLKAMKKTFL